VRFRFIDDERAIEAAFDHLAQLADGQRGIDPAEPRACLRAAPSADDGIDASISVDVANPPPDHVRGGHRQTQDLP